MATLAQKMAKASNLGSGIRALARSELEVDVTVTAVATTSIFVPLPDGSRLLGIRTVTDTAFTAVTDAQLTAGSAAGGAQYVAAGATVKAVGVVTHTLVNAAAAAYESMSGGLYLNLVQSGGSTAVGSAKVYIAYALPA
jgi:hypothetical protein